jgi:hypothetical protein
LPESEQPVLSVVIAIASDTTAPTDTRHLGPCVAALKRQSGAVPMEIIVPLPPGVAGLEDLRRIHPDVRFLEVEDLRKHTGQGNSREHHGELIARGFALARGSIIALIEDHDFADVDWSARLMEAHRSPFAGVGGAIENGIDRPLNWAVYFCDFLRYQNPLPEGESTRASDANVSYKRRALENIRPVWAEEFHEAMVNGALLGSGEKLSLAPGVVVYQRRQDLRLSAALRERYVWGRSFGAWRCQQAGAMQRLFWAVFSPALPVLIPLRMTLMAIRKRRTLRPFLIALPITAVLAACWSWGEFTGYVTGRALPRARGTANVPARGAHVVL